MDLNPRCRHAGRLTLLAAVSVALALLLLSAACSSLPGADRGAAEARAVSAARRNPAKRLETYGFDPSVRLVDRIGPAPEELLAYLRTMDSNPRYVSHEASPGELSLFAEYYADLPAPFRAVMEEKVVGVFVIEDFVGGGMSDFILGPDGTMYAVLVLNSRIFELSLREWVEYRDNSSFTEGGPVAGNGLGSRYRGLLHTLAHESAHIYDYFRRATPGVEKTAPNASTGRGSRTEFTAGVWESYAKPAAAFEFAHREKLAAYDLGPRLDAGLAVDLYRALAATPFSSLYGSWNWAEDFAETFAWYHIERIYGLEYWVEISFGSEVLFRFEPTKNPLVLARHALCEELTR